jgi:DNA-binding CsgD family transcriptional regulator
VVEHKMLIRELEPHVYGAIAAHWRLVEAEQAAKVSRFALDQLPLGIIWLGPNAKVLHANAMAQRILDRRDGLFMMGGKLRASAGGRDLDAAIISLGTRQPESSFAVPRREGRALFVTLVPGSAQDVLGSAGDTVSTLVFVADPDHMPANAASRLRVLYGLSNAEAEIAELLAAGLTVEAIAERRTVSVHTIKTQMKFLMGKLGASRQSDVVRAVMALGLMPA